MGAAGERLARVVPAPCDLPEPHPDEDGKPDALVVRIARAWTSSREHPMDDDTPIMPAIRAACRHWDVLEVAYDPDQWNAFGTSDPRSASGSLTTDCEINPARSGVNRQVAGIFRRAVESQYLLLFHRGLIGGGKSGVGKSLFWEHFRLERSEVTKGHAQTRVAVVADLDASDAVQRIGEFVDEVKRIKGLASAGGPSASTPIRDLFAAFISGYVEATREPLINHPSTGRSWTCGKP